MRKKKTKIDWIKFNNQYKFDYFLEENSKSIITDAMNNSEPLNSIILMKLLRNHYQNSPNGLKRIVQ